MIRVLQCFLIWVLSVSLCLGGDEKAQTNPALPTIFIVGDSTVRNGTKGQRGWGEEIGAYFDPEKINVVNLAIGGRSSRTFITEGRWNDALGRIKPGDMVLVQFGHNDGGPLNDNTRARGSIKGTGEQTEEIDNILTKKHEVVHTYGWYLRKYIRDAKEKQARPVICSPIPRKTWKDDQTVVRSGAGSYGGWALEIAAREGALSIDLNDIVATGYEKVGRTKVEDFFADAHTHTTVEGARFNAEAVIAGLKTLKGDPFAPYFSKEATGIPAFEPHR
jgi:rhamnogalacturonan acetylesterase